MGALSPATVIDKNSGVGRSWRVDILPFLGQEALFAQYKQNEPWDSENNKKVLAQMPDVFRHQAQLRTPQIPRSLPLTAKVSS